MIEILILAVVAVYLCGRLWSVLGARTGEEKKRSFFKEPRDEPSSSTEKRSEIILGPKDVEVSTTPHTLHRRLDQLLSIDPSFSADHFLKGAEKAFRLILKFYGEHDIPSLRDLLTPDFFKLFSKSIEDQKEQGLGPIDVKELVSDIQDIDIREEAIYVKVWFKSFQIRQGLDKGNDLHDKPGENNIAHWVVDLWTFRRCRKTSDSMWFLSHVEGHPA